MKQRFLGLIAIALILFSSSVFALDHSQTFNTFTSNNAAGSLAKVHAYDTLTNKNSTYMFSDYLGEWYVGTLESKTNPIMNIQSIWSQGDAKQFAFINHTTTSTGVIEIYLNDFILYPDTQIGYYYNMSATTAGMVHITFIFVDEDNNCLALADNVAQTAQTNLYCNAEKMTYDVWGGTATKDITHEVANLAALDSSYFKYYKKLAIIMSPGVAGTYTTVIDNITINGYNSHNYTDLNCELSYLPNYCWEYGETSYYDVQYTLSCTHEDNADIYYSLDVNNYYNIKTNYEEDFLTSTNELDYNWFYNGHFVQNYTWLVDSLGETSLCSMNYYCYWSNLFLQSNTDAAGNKIAILTSNYNVQDFIILSGQSMKSTYTNAIKYWLPLNDTYFEEQILNQAHEGYVIGFNQSAGNLRVTMDGVQIFDEPHHKDAVIYTTYTLNQTTGTITYQLSYNNITTGTNSVTWTENQYYDYDYYLGSKFLSYGSVNKPWGIILITLEQTDVYLTPTDWSTTLPTIRINSSGTMTADIYVTDYYNKYTGNYLTYSMNLYSSDSAIYCGYLYNGSYVNQTTSGTSFIDLIFKPLFEDILYRTGMTAIAQGLFWTIYVVFLVIGIFALRQFHLAFIFTNIIMFIWAWLGFANAGSFLGIMVLLALGFAGSVGDLLK